MRRSLLLIPLFLAVAVPLAVLVPQLWPARSPHLSAPAQAAVAGLLQGTRGSTDVDAICGRLPARPATDDQLRRVLADCRASARMWLAMTGIESCDDAACARAHARRAAGGAREAAAIEEGFAGQLRGRCRAFFEAQAAYGRAIADAGDALTRVLADAARPAALDRWRRAVVAAERPFDDGRVPALLAACDPASP